MKSTDLFQIKVNHFGSHIVVDLMIVIIITAISIFLFILLNKRENSELQEGKTEFNVHHFYEFSLIIILLITHFLFSLWPVLVYGLEKSLSSIEFFILPFTYGIYLTFMMKKINNSFDQNSFIINKPFFKLTVRLLIHFSIVPLIMVSILVLIN